MYGIHILSGCTVCIGMCTTLIFTYSTFFQVHTEYTYTILCSFHRFFIYSDFLVSLLVITVVDEFGVRFQNIYSFIAVIQD